MATSPVLQAVLLWQHHQTTTPYLPGATAAGPTAATAPLPEPAVEEVPAPAPAPAPAWQEQPGQEEDPESDRGMPGLGEMSGLGG
jgi:hypothetical protein